MTEGETGSSKQELSGLRDFFRSEGQKEKDLIEKGLTETERTVLDLSLGTKNEEGETNGLTASQISPQLDLSPWKVNEILEKAYRKLRNLQTRV